MKIRRNVKELFNGVDIHFLNGMGKGTYSEEEQKAFEAGVYQCIYYFRRFGIPIKMTGRKVWEQKMKGGK